MCLGPITEKGSNNQSRASSSTTKDDMNATRNKNQSTDASDKEVTDDEADKLPPYTLSDHCKHLKLKSERSESHQYWYCDWTNRFVERNSKVDLTDLIKDYCQPFAQLSELQANHVGLDPISLQKDDPYAIRTVSIRLRVDAKQHLIMKAVHEAFTALHSVHYLILKSTMHTFQAIGADGTEPLVLVANVTTHKTNLERRLWLRFFHVDQIYLEEEQLQTVGGIKHQKAPLRKTNTPLNAQLAEASALVQMIKEMKLQPLDDAPCTSREQTSEHLLTKFAPSKSALSIFYKEIHTLYPSLSTKDKEVFQETHPLMDRIWSELDMAKCTFNSLVEESSRFGMRPCQPTLDKEFCFHLSQISQQHMLLELYQEMENAQNILHNVLCDYSELENLLKKVLTENYKIQLPEFGGSDQYLDVGQTPNKMPKRKFADFPWHPKVRKALDDITARVASDCLQAFDPKLSLQISDDAVDWVLSAFGCADDNDQKTFLKKRNRQSMIRITQQQGRVKLLLEKLILLPQNYPHLPQVMNMANQWYEISLHAKTSNIRRNPLPILVFKTRLGQGCITSHQLMLVTGIFRTEVLVFDWMDIDVCFTPNHPLTKIAILENGKKVTGFNPRDVDIPVVVKICQTLKALQEG